MASWDDYANYDQRESKRERDDDRESDRKNIII